MTPIESLLSRLTKVKGRNGSWTACCPAHEDKSPSLAVRETPDGKVLIHCFGGCPVNDVLGAVGMDLTDLFPPSEGYDPNKPKTKPKFYASDLLRIISFEALVVSICAADMSKGKELNERDRERLKVAHQRIVEATNYANI